MNFTEYFKSTFFAKNLGKFQRYTAFTLAEVLITLGIIGVVAALTIPTIIANQQEKTTVSTLKKAYSSLSQAYTMAVQENGTPDNWELVAQDSPAGAGNMINILGNSLRILKNCGNSDFSCFPDVYYKYLNGQPKAKATNTNYSRAQLADGMLIETQVWSPNCSRDWGDGNYNNVCGRYSVDINGFKNPNQEGVDYFLFYLTKNGIMPAGAPNNGGFTFSGFCRDKSLGLIAGMGSNGTGCTAWVIYNENMDYLKCDDLSWDGKTKCD